MQISSRLVSATLNVIVIAFIILASISCAGTKARAKETASTQPAFHFVDGDGYRELQCGDTPIYRYMIKYDPSDHANTFKPFYHVYGFHNEGFITKGPGGWFTHHRGIFFGFKTQYGDFWHCPDVHQQHVAFLKDKEQITDDFARTASTTDWIAKDGKAKVRDTREVTAYREKNGELVLDYVITVESLPGSGEVDLGGDPHHAGFHFRAAQEVTGQPEDSKAGMTGLATFITPPGAKEGKNSTTTNADWVACQFMIKDHHYVVAHFDHPSNPRPITYSVRPYGRFGSFCPMKVSEGKPLTLKYRIIIMDGAWTDAAKFTKDALAQRYAEYSKQ